MNNLIVKQRDISMLKMSTNPPEIIVKSNYCLIANGKVYQWVGIGWTVIRDATEEDYKTLPQTITPHCSHCRDYESLPEDIMYCKRLKRRITARKQPCRNYKEKD